MSKDTGKLLTELRILVGEINLTVYNINVRRAGYGIAYAVPTDDINVGPLRINAYYPSLRKAVICETELMIHEIIEHRKAVRQRREKVRGVR